MSDKEENKGGGEGVGRRWYHGPLIYKIIESQQKNTDISYRPDLSNLNWYDSPARPTISPAKY